MQRINVNNFQEWRNAARLLLAQDTHPADIDWQESDTLQASLLGECDAPHKNLVLNPVRVPRKLIALAKTVACHRQTEKWGRLYALLWRIAQGEKNVLKISSDPLVHQLSLMYKNVRRDVHKMKAFVRFQLYQKNEQALYVAWHEPDHKILRLAAPFFKERFSVQQWIIFTPDGSLSWNGEALIFNDLPITKTQLTVKDEMEKLWQVYYRAIFNPARIKIKAMKKEMPVRYWKNMPETQLIPSLLEEAPRRVAEMLSKAGI